jgi:glycerol-3-phosphate acyltransferase PlsY
LAVLAVWLVVAVASRYSSLASITAALVAPAITAYLHGVGSIFYAVLGMSALLIWRHQANIAKLARGEESKIGASRKAGSVAVKL